MNASSKHLVNRSWKAIYLLNSTFKQIDLKTMTRLKFFDRLIAPILKYNSEVWESMMHVPPHKTNDRNFWEKVESLPFEKMHLRYMKIILNTHSKTTNAAVKGELGWHPIGIYIVKNMLKFWDRICDEQYIGRSPRRGFTHHAFMLHCTFSPHLLSQHGVRRAAQGEGVLVGGFANIRPRNFIQLLVRYAMCWECQF